LKNAYVACGIVGFAALVSIASAVPGDGRRAFAAAVSAHGGVIIAAGIVLLVRVATDAALCDLDDEQADRRFGTATLPTTIGAGRTWAATGLVRCALPGVILAMPWFPWRARAAWAAASLAGVVILRVWRPRAVRDVVDLRMAVEAAGVVAILALA
jgi:hypothetical protein